MPWGLSRLFTNEPASRREYTFCVMVHPLPDAADRALVVEHVDDVVLASALIDQRRDQGHEVDAIMVEKIVRGNMISVTSHKMVEHDYGLV